MDDLLPVGLSFLLGARHGAGPDHLAAVAALVARGGGRAGALEVATRFAAGHAAILLLAAAAVSAAGPAGLVPPGAERVGELLAGAMLVGLGIHSLRTGRSYVHAHAHAHEGGFLHSHPHAHDGGDHRSHAHRHSPLLLGGAFALAGLPAHLLHAAPVLAARGLAGRLACAAAFGAGIVASMLAFAVAASAATSGVREPRRLVNAAAVLAVGVGAVWIALNLG